MEKLIERTQGNHRTRSFKKGSTLLFQGEIPRHAFIIDQGVVRAYSVKTSGEESIAALFTKGDILPIPWLLSTTTNTLFYYDALEDVRVTCINKSDFNDIVMQDPALLGEMLQYISKQYTAMLVRITGLSQSRAIEKISYIFYYLLFRYGTETSGGFYQIDLKLNHSMIASLTGLTRESTTNNLRVLKEKGIVNYTRSSFSVNKKLLENFIGEDGFRELSL